jgi:hypothetical protein
VAVPNTTSPTPQAFGTYNWRAQTQNMNGPGMPFMQPQSQNPQGYTPIQQWGPNGTSPTTSPTMMQNIGQGVGLAQSGMNLYGTLRSIQLMNKKFKFEKKNTKGNFNAGALVYNNTLTDRQNGLDRYNEYHGTEYGPTNQLSYMSEWGKPQNQPNQADFDRSERPAPTPQQDPKRYG